MSKKEWEYWIKERCKEEALKYKLRSEFKKYSSSAYTICFKNGWLDVLFNFFI